MGRALRVIQIDDSSACAQLASTALRRAAEDALRESEARKTAMFDGALDAIVAIDPDGRIAELNPAAEAMFGRDQAGLAGQPIAGLIPPLADPSGGAGRRGNRVEVTARR